MNAMEVPREFLVLDAEDQMRVVLEIWLRLHHSDARMAKFTHARASFNNISGGAIIGNIEWYLLIADDNSVQLVQPVKLGQFAHPTVRKIVEHFARQAPGATSGQITFRFSPPTVGVDLLSDHNEPLFGRHVIDLAADQRARDAMRITTH